MKLKNIVIKETGNCKNMFVVNADYTNRYLYNILLKNNFKNVNIRCYHSPKNFLKDIKHYKNNNNYLITEIILPDVDGYTFIKEVNNKYPNTKIGILSTIKKNKFNNVDNLNFNFYETIPTTNKKIIDNINKYFKGL